MLLPTVGEISAITILDVSLGVDIVLCPLVGNVEYAGGYGAVALAKLSEESTGSFGIRVCIDTLPSEFPGCSWSIGADGCVDLVILNLKLELLLVRLLPVSFGSENLQIGQQQQQTNVISNNIAADPIDMDAINQIFQSSSLFELFCA